MNIVQILDVLIELKLYITLHGKMLSYKYILSIGLTELIVTPSGFVIYLSVLR